ncbi:MAG: hypothetical protein K2Y02_03680 [Burkholderiaceae bacterium]|nr:hypothetical protein [Burkholderiaceae bacterium]
MSDEKIDPNDLIASLLSASERRFESMMAAHAAFSKDRKPHEDRDFQPAIRKALGRRYKEMRAPNWQASSDALEDQCELFLGIVEAYGNGLGVICASLPPGQDARRANVRQLSSALQRLQDVLLKLDSGALGQTLNEIDKALNGGVAQIATDPAEAFIAAGHLRMLASEPLSAVIVAATNAAKVLDEPNYDPILEVIWHLERLFDDHALPFETKDTGFAADCFREMYELAKPGESKDRPKYLLKKAVSDPRSWASFKAKMNKKHP